jgi:hypothetical protein
MFADAAGVVVSAFRWWGRCILTPVQRPLRLQYLAPREIMSTKLKLFVLAAVLIVLGIGLFVWAPAEPETECAKGPETSGFVDEEKDCPISIESWEKIQEANSGPKWDNIGGLALVVGGLAVAIVALVKKSNPKA